jgi:hypothetical protein
VLLIRVSLPIMRNLPPPFIRSLHCESAQFLWNAFFNRFGLAWVMPRGVMDLLHCWWSAQCGGLENGSALYHVVSLV